MFTQQFKFLLGALLVIIALISLVYNQLALNLRITSLEHRIATLAVTPTLVPVTPTVAATPTAVLKSRVPVIQITTIPTPKGGAK